MARLDPAAFDGKEVERVFVGMSMRDCSRVEAVLTAASVDYIVEVEQIDAGPFAGTLNAAVFYVLAGQAEYCKRHLESEGLALH